MAGRRWVTATATLPTGNANENDDFGAWNAKRGPFHLLRSIVRVCSDLQRRPVHIHVPFSLTLEEEERRTHRKDMRRLISQNAHGQTQHSVYEGGGTHRERVRRRHAKCERDTRRIHACQQESTRGERKHGVHGCVGYSEDVANP